MTRFFIGLILLVLAGFALSAPAQAQFTQCELAGAGEPCELDVNGREGICNDRLECVEIPPQGRTDSVSCTSQCDDTDKGLCIPNPLTDCDIVSFLDRVATLVLQLSVFVAVAMVIVAGVMYITAGGNKERVQRATRTLVYALVGFAVVILAKALVMIIKAALGG